MPPKLSGIGYVRDLAGPVIIPEAIETSVCPQDPNPEGLGLHSVTPTLLSDGTLHPQSSTTGFMFHKNCYQLLEWACYPLPINIRTLNLFLRSFGVMPDGQLVNWGHTFAGLYAKYDANNRTIHMRHNSSHPFGTNRYEANPLIIENKTLWEKLGGYMLKHLLEKSKTMTEMPQVHSEAQMLNERQQGHLVGLPAELLEYILMLLPSEDLVNARLASRTFSVIPLSKAFWRSRFAVGQDFESIIEPWLYQAEVIRNPRFAEPRKVYKVLKSESSSRVLANRRRIWELNRPLVSALQSFALHEKACDRVEPSGRPLASLWQPDLEDEDLSRWDCAHGELLDSELQPYHFGCRPLFKRYITLPAPVVTVKVSVLPFHDTTYITGLRFCLTDGSEEAIGYILSDKEVSIPTEGTLRGMKVATGECGVHGLSIVNKHGTQSVIAGVMAGLKHKRLGLGNPVTNVKASFDGLKMVFIGVPDYIHKATGPYSIWKQASEYIEISSLPNR
ncbi:Nn.00g109010.m01.CDS01 [Neocucurbitaria sp. VM-36]